MASLVPCLVSTCFVLTGKEFYHLVSTHQTACQTNKHMIILRITDWSVNIVGLGQMTLTRTYRVIRPSLRQAILKRCRLPISTRLISSLSRQIRAEAR